MLPTLALQLIDSSVGHCSQTSSLLLLSQLEKFTPQNPKELSHGPSSAQNSASENAPGLTDVLQEELDES